MNESPDEKIVPSPLWEEIAFNIYQVVFRKMDLAPGSIPFISIDLVGNISFLTIFTHSVWYLAMRELKSKQNATPNRSQRLQMSQLVSCVEHGFGLWFVKLYS